MGLTRPTFHDNGTEHAYIHTCEGPTILVVLSTAFGIIVKEACYNLTTVTKVHTVRGTALTQTVTFELSFHQSDNGIINRLRT